MVSDSVDQPANESSSSAVGGIVLGGLTVSSNDPVRPENTMAITAIRRARMYERAMVGLIEVQSDNSIPIAHLAGFAVELGLKAYLLGNGHSEAEAKTIRHNLKEGWNLANGSGLNISQNPPDWLTRLDGLHTSMLLRYPHRSIAGLVIPGQATLQQGIAELLSMVEANIGK